LDPFNGSGSTGKAAMLCKTYNYIGIDLSAEYITISKARIENASIDKDIEHKDIKQTDKDIKQIDTYTQFFTD
jgi:DNA modification methylase